MLDKIKLFVYKYYDQKISRKCTKLGQNCLSLTNPAKVIFEYGNQYIFSNAIFIEYANTNSLVPSMMPWDQH